MNLCMSVCPVFAIFILCVFSFTTFYRFFCWGLLFGGWTSWWRPTFLIPQTSKFPSSLFCVRVVFLYIQVRAHNGHFKVHLTFGTETTLLLLLVLNFGPVHISEWNGRLIKTKIIYVGQCWKFFESNIKCTTIIFSINYISMQRGVSNILWDLWFLYDERYYQLEYFTNLILHGY